MAAAVGPAPSELEARAREALSAVFDPELDEPITDLGFVRSVRATTDGRLDVHLRLPTSFCSPNFAWIMAGDARDALRAVPGVTAVHVELDDHHDSGLINRGLAAGADYKATFGHEAERDLDELRLTFARKAHTAAVERAVAAVRGADPDRSDADLARLVLADLPAQAPTTVALLRRRAALGLPVDPAAPVLVDDAGTPWQADQVVAQLRRARSVRISIDGNAHFCRGLLRTRYPGSEADQTDRPADPSTAPTIDPGHRPLIPLGAVAS